MSIRETNHFVSRRAAIHYYNDYLGNSLEVATKLVNEGLADSAIFIGRPPTTRNETVYVKAESGRFCINDLSKIIAMHG